MYGWFDLNHFSGAGSERLTGYHIARLYFISFAWRLSGSSISLWSHLVGSG